MPLETCSETEMQLLLYMLLVCHVRAERNKSVMQSSSLKAGKAEPGLSFGDLSVCLLT